MTLSQPVSAQPNVIERRRLLVALYGLLGVAVMAVLWLLGSSLAPSARAQAERPRVTLPPLAAGEFAYIPDPTSLDYFPTELLVLRKPDGAWRIWSIPSKDGVRSLPDIHWWQRGPNCLRLEPDVQVGVIACTAPADSRSSVENYRWDLNGRHIGRHFHVDDMMEVKGEMSGTYYVFAPR